MVIIPQRALGKDHALNLTNDVMSALVFARRQPGFIRGQKFRLDGAE